MAIIEVKNLNKQFQVQERGAGLARAMRALITRKKKTIHAVMNMNFKIEKGDFVGFIGPNGAGKSTTLKMLTGILVPTSGEARVLGVVPWEKREENARNIGVVFGQRTQLWWDLPVTETFQLLKHIYEIPESKFKRNVKRFSKILGINKFLKTPVRKLSLGERMRCELASSLLHDPKVLFLDEPAIGLDVVAKERIREFLRDINQKKKTTIILTTHDMRDVEELCPRIIIIDKGKKLFDGPIEKIKKRFAKRRVLTIDLYENKLSEKVIRGGVKKIKGAKFISKKETEIKLSVNTEISPISGLIKTVLSKWNVRDVTIEVPTIEDIIRRIYKEGLL